MIKFKGSEIDTSSGICRGIMSALASDKKMTMKDIIQQYNLTAPEKLSQQNLSAKLKRDSMYFNELVGIAESIGYDLILVPHGGKEEIEVQAERIAPSKKEQSESRSIKEERESSSDIRFFTLPTDIQAIIPLKLPDGQSVLVKGVKAKNAEKAYTRYIRDWMQRNGEIKSIDDLELPDFFEKLSARYGVSIQPMEIPEDDE